MQWVQLVEEEEAGKLKRINLYHEQDSVRTTFCMDGRLVSDAARLQSEVESVEGVGIKRRCWRHISDHNAIALASQRILKDPGELTIAVGNSCLEN